MTIAKGNRGNTAQVVVDHLCVHHVPKPLIYISLGAGLLFIRFTIYSVVVFPSFFLENQ